MIRFLNKVFSDAEIIVFEHRYSIYLFPQETIKNILNFNAKRFISRKVIRSLS